jgi:hypothetical protein
VAQKADGHFLVADELKETLFKQESIKPPLRVDCAYLARSRQREAAGPFVLHIEEETVPSDEVEVRLAEYAMRLRERNPVGESNENALPVKLLLP